MNEAKPQAMDSDSAEPKAQGRGRLLRVVIALALLLLLVGAGRQLGAELDAFRTWVKELGVLGPLVFAAVYAIAVVAAAPASLLTIAAGGIFGIGVGAVTVYLGAVVGSGAAFLVARYLAREAVARRIEKRPSFAAIDRAVGERGLKIVFLLRLSPVFPFNLLNYALGLTRVRFRDYMLGALGMIPGTFLYVYIGSLSTEVAVASGGGAEYGRLALQVVGGVATLVVTVLVTRIARNALRAAGATDDAGDAAPETT